MNLKLGSNINQKHGGALENIKTETTESRAVTNQKDTWQQNKIIQDIKGKF